MASVNKHLFVVYVTLMVMKMRMVVNGDSQVPCYFIFGDSLFDNGNNNGLLTSARVNFPPYGIDFPEGATGRFSNGRNLPDFIAELLGFDTYIPPFATARGLQIFKGVNYASGGAGILDETGRQLGGRISLNLQLLNHKSTTSKIAVLLGSKQLAKEYLNKCLYTVGMGNNDYINNYLMPKYYSSSYIYTPDQYAKLLVQRYSKQIRILHDFGARKVALFGLGLIGCTPEEIARFGANESGCVDFINGYVQLFNVRLEKLVDELNNDLADATFIYINSTSISSDDPSPLVANAPCCKVSTNFGKGQCIPGSVACSDRNSYVFWDAFHPTEIANAATAQRAYSAQTPSDAYPMDIRSLVQLITSSGTLLDFVPLDFLKGGFNEASI